MQACLCDVVIEMVSIVKGLALYDISREEALLVYRHMLFRDQKAVGEVAVPHQQQPRTVIVHADTASIRVFGMPGFIHDGLDERQKIRQYVRKIINPYRCRIVKGEERRRRSQRMSPTTR
jgi:hypothetical protein